ncbi:hypothetical protein B296_00005867 [Ensete ventricosum]|uniref:Amino acid transporter transmembrane domain-containing protein n=1 Tax=Ensete ventricosum TaxID=4639 RepID=A0A427A6Q4_ENSVE|nr:hypothetical protein B296_00005867 [Ensete ventricosum]
MLPQKQAEEAIVSRSNSTLKDELEQDVDGKGEDEEAAHGFNMKSFLWHGGSAWDAWFSCASNQVLPCSISRISCFGMQNAWQVAQVLLTLPYSFSQLGMLSGIILQLFYGFMGSWTAYLISVLYVEYRTRKEKENASFKNHVIQVFFFRAFLSASLACDLIAMFLSSLIWWRSSNIYYINDRLDKRTWTYIFGACCATTVFIPSFHNYRIWSFLGLGMTTYTAYYLTIAAVVHGQVEGVTHSGPTKLVLYFTGATNILYTFGGHAVTV